MFRNLPRGHLRIESRCVLWDCMPFVASGTEAKHGGGGGIRTHGTFRLSSFQDWRNRPLYHPSVEVLLGREGYERGGLGFQEKLTIFLEAMKKGNEKGKEKRGVCDLGFPIGGGVSSLMR